MDPENHQMSFFADHAVLFAAAEAAGEKITEEEIQMPASVRAKKNKPAKELPRRIEIIALCEADKICACGAHKTVIRYETKELLHYQPAVFELIEQRREVAACSKGCDGQIVTAPSPLQVLPKAKASEALLAFLVVSKLDDRQPLYHLEKQLFERHGVDCSRQTMARWLIDLMEPMQPLYNLLKDEIIGYDVASCDATTLQVLKEPGRRVRRNPMPIVCGVVRLTNRLSCMITTTNFIKRLLPNGLRDLPAICMWMVIISLSRSWRT